MIKMDENIENHTEAPAYDNDGKPVEAPIGVDTEPTNDSEQETANESAQGAQDFNNAVYAAVQEYQSKVPLNYMMKILTAVIVDLQAALLGTNITWVKQY